MSNGQTVDAGTVVGPQGPAGGTTSGTGGVVSFANVIPQVETKIVRIDCSIVGGLSSGSGTIVDARGFIVTNAHVIAGARTIQVTLKDGTVLGATQISSDARQDLAIIKLNSNRTDFPVMTLGSNSDAVTGEPVMAGGFPMGTDLPGPASFTQGVISCALRDLDGDKYVQVDAAVNPGNSGGCMFTLSGKMIGVPSAGLVPPGEDFEMINLIIPIDQVKAYMAANIK
jgi:S1-C subfamily serine protease